MSEAIIPCRFLRIAGVSYRLGELAPAQITDLRQWHRQVLEHVGGTRSVRTYDRDPTLPLQHLLYAGGEGVEFEHLRDRIKAEHIVAAALELGRQSVERINE